MRKLFSWLCIGLLILGSVGGVLGAEITANCYTKCDGIILPTGTTDSSNYTYHNASNKKASSIKNATNTVELDSDAIYNDYGINTSSKNWRIDCRYNTTTAEVNKSMNLSKYINGTNYADWVKGELENPDVVANDTLFVSPRPEDNESGYWVEKSFHDIFPFVIKRQADGVHIDCVKVLVVFYEFVAHPTPEPEPQPEPVNNSTNGTDVTNVTNNSADVDVDVVDNSTIVNGTVVPAVAGNDTVPVSETAVADEDNDGNNKVIDLSNFRTGSTIDLLILSIIIVLLCGFLNWRRNH